MSGNELGRGKQRCDLMSLHTIPSVVLPYHMELPRSRLVLVGLARLD